jgi:hypothetical protein
VKARGSWAREKLVMVMLMPWGISRAPKLPRRNPAEDDHGRVGGQAAYQGGRHEPADADEVEAALAIPIAEAAADDQGRPDRELVAGTEPFDER